MAGPTPQHRDPARGRTGHPHLTNNRSPPPRRQNQGRATNRKGYIVDSTTAHRSQAALDRMSAVVAGMQAMHAWCTNHLTDQHLGYYDSTEVLIPVEDAAGLADLTRVLKDGAPLGAVTKSASGDYLNVSRDFGGGVKVTAYVARGDACEYVVTGSETVEVPDPDAPMVTVVREVGEWKCAPILAGAADGEVTA